MTLTVRAVAAGDRADWERLYQGYGEFYKVTQTAGMRSTVWGWLQDPACEVEGLVAVDGGGRLIGITHFRAYLRPLSASVGGFLDDLFVDPGARGSGAAQALIDAVAEVGRHRGWTVIRWITAADNTRARAVYDRVAVATPWVTYDIKL